MSVARVHVRAWQSAYRGLLPDEYLDHLRPEERAEKYDFVTRDPQKPQTIVAVVEGTICGFATTAPSRDADLAEYGELAALNIDPDYWRRGIGTALLSTARERLTGLGYENALLWVLVGNVRADHFYRKDQWAPDDLHRTDTVWGVTVNEIRYRRKL